MSDDESIILAQAAELVEWESIAPILRAWWEGDVDACPLCIEAAVSDLREWCREHHELLRHWEHGEEEVRT